VRALLLLMLTLSIRLYVTLSQKANSYYTDYRYRRSYIIHTRKCPNDAERRAVSPRNLQRRVVRTTPQCDDSTVILTVDENIACCRKANDGMFALKSTDAFSFFHVRITMFAAAAIVESLR